MMALIGLICFLVGTGLGIWATRSVYRSRISQMAMVTRKLLQADNTVRALHYLSSFEK